jgi:chromosome segregation ATPase
MAEIAELESRITAALDRIRAGISGMSVSADLPTQSADDPRVAELLAQLAEEKTVTAQLEQRVRALKDRQDGQMADLSAREEHARTRLAGVDRDIQKLRQANAELRANNAKLREALSDGIAEPQLINKAIVAELEAIRALRGVDAAEVDLVIDALTPIIEEAR